MVNYCFYIQPFYDNIIKEYTHIVVINNLPDGPLKNYVKKTIMPEISLFNGFNAFKSNASCSRQCVYAIKNINNCNNSGYQDLLSVDNIDELIVFLTENNYTINKDITKIMNNDKIMVNNGKKLLFYVNYN